MKISKDKMIDMYRVMLRIRRFEERVTKEFAAGHIPGFLHLYLGEEAIAVGTCANLRSADFITSTHRGHGHVIAKGCQTDRMMAELYGKQTGYNRGKGGSMHIADVNLGILGANAIVGAGITIAGGAAISAHLRSTDQVTVCFIGDGATNTSRFHEGVNLAATWKLPIVYVVENNGYAESTHLSAAINTPNIAARGAAYGIPAQTIDGNDVLTVYNTVWQAIARARKGDGPSIVECMTSRLCGHYEGDAQTYRPKGEVEEARKNEPITRFEKYLSDNGIINAAGLKKIQQQIEAEIEQAVKFAEDSPLPEPEDTLSGVYA